MQIKATVLQPGARVGWWIGENAMRSIFALSLLIALCAAANAATAHHGHDRHVRSSQGRIADPVSGFARAPVRPMVHDRRSAPMNDQPGTYDNRYPNWGGGM
jgi:hypothetical protein